MVFVKHFKSSRLLLLSFCSLFVVGQAVAQTVDVLWRVSNNASSTVISSAVGPLENPFPLVEPKVSAEAAESASAAAVVAQVEALKGEMEALMHSGAAFSVDLSQLLAVGYLQGPKGSAVLINGQWLRPGKVLTVPLKGTDRALAILQELESLDTTTAGALKQSLQAQLTGKGATHLKLRSVAQQQVTLVDDAGTQYVISSKH